MASSISTKLYCIVCHKPFDVTKFYGHHHDGNETRKASGEKETQVQTVDHHSSADQGQMERQRNVEVIHQPHPSDGNTGRDGVLAGATAAIVNSIQSAKDAISGNAGESKKK